MIFAILGLSLIISNVRSDMSVTSYFNQELTKFTQTVEEQISQLTSFMIGDFPQKHQSWKKSNSIHENKDISRQNYFGDMPLTYHFQQQQQSDQPQQHQQRILALTITQREFFRNESLFQQPLINPRCQNKGKAILINQTQFYCNGTRKSWEQYNQTKLDDPNYDQHCKTVYRLLYACLCPRDFSGVKCEIWNPIVCDMQSVPLLDCPQFYSNYYNSKLDGDPPCQQVSSSSVVTELIKVICYNYDQTKIANEKVEYDKPFDIIWSNYTEGIFRLQPKYYNLYYLEAVLHASHYFSNLTNSTNSTDSMNLTNQTNQSSVRILGTDNTVSSVTIPIGLSNNFTGQSTNNSIDNQTDFTNNSATEINATLLQLLQDSENTTYNFTPITYKYNSSILVSTFNVEISPIIQYPDWKNILSSIQYQPAYTLSLNQLLSISPTAIQHQFDILYEKGVSNYGRFYYMTNLKLIFPDQDSSRTLGKTFICSKTSVTGSYEDMFYQEPAYIKKIPKGFMIGIILLVCALVIISASMIFYYKKRILQRKLEEECELQKKKILLKMQNNYKE